MITGVSFRPSFSRRRISRMAFWRCSWTVGLGSKSRQFIYASLCLASLSDVQRDDAQEVLVIHLGQQQLTSLIEQVASQARLCFDEGDDSLFHGAAAQKFMDHDVAFLPD